MHGGDCQIFLGCINHGGRDVMVEREKLAARIK
jgi:hypothetical protein